MELTPAVSTRYALYLQTPHWREKRNTALRLAKFRCTRCGGKRGLEVHHKTYERLGFEYQSDLEVVCGQCHADHHIAAEKETPLGLFLKIGSDVLREYTYASVADLADVIKTRCAKARVAYDRHQVDRAIHLLLASNRLKSAAADTCVRPDESPDVAMTHEEAVAWLRRLNGGERFDVPLPVMPDAQPMTHGDLFRQDKHKAKQMIVTEILDSIARCEALEHELEAMT